MSDESERMNCDKIVAGTPTMNGRTYSRECLEGMVRDCNSKVMLVTGGFCEGTQLDLSKAVGHARDFELSVSGTVSAAVNLYPFSPISKTMLDQFDFSPMVLGCTDESGNVWDVNVMYWTLTPKEDS